MMMRAYNEMHLDDAMYSLADMLEFAVCDLQYDIDDFFDLFIQSKVAKEFALGNPKYIAGMSGYELAYEVIYHTYAQRISIAPMHRVDKTPAYWVGWALAYYQWLTGFSFEKIHRALPLYDLLRWYPTMHETDITVFVDCANHRIQQYDMNHQTMLALIRKARGYSQKQLADASGVSLRMIQLYEQRQNDIKKATANTVISLSRALGCKMEDVLDL